MPRKKLPEQEKIAREEERKLRRAGYIPAHPVSNTYGNEETAKYIASRYKEAIIVFHPHDKNWGNKTWKVWVKPCKLTV